LVLLHSARAHATTYNVATAAGLVSAVAAANANLGPDTIILAPGYYLVGSNFTPLDVTDDLTVLGAGRPGTVLDGGGSGGAAFDVHRSFTSNPINNDIQATFRNLTIQNFHPGIGFSSGPASQLLVDGVTIMGSHTDGLDLSGGPVHLLNTTICSNTRGILIESGDSLVFDNVTIVDNAENGIEKYGGPLTVRNSIISYNGTDCSGHPDAADHNIDGDGTCGSGFTTTDALLTVLADNGGPTPTFALPVGSPAIDAGAGGSAVDQRGVTRPQGSAGDIGSFEWTTLAFKSVHAAVGAGGSVTTDTTGTGATPADPVQTTITAPGGGTFTLDEGPGAAGFGFLGQTVQITASPDATPANPFRIVFVIDASVIPAGESAATIVVKKNGVTVPPASGAPGTAVPDPCVSSRVTLPSGDAQITVLSSSASTWQFAPHAAAGVSDTPARLAFAISPRPMREAAIIRFALPVAADVDLSLFDLAGRKVATVVAGHRNAGRYEVTWNQARELAAGVYFARFRAGNAVRSATVVRVN
jgi:hypothetical protein